MVALVAFIFQKSINHLATNKWPKFEVGRLQYQIERRSARRRLPWRYDNHIQEPPFYTNAAGRSLKNLPVTDFTHLFIMMCITRFWDKNKPHLKLDNKIIQPTYYGTLANVPAT